MPKRKAHRTAIKPLVDTQSPETDHTPSLVLRAQAERVAALYEAHGPGQPTVLADAGKVYVFLSALAEGNYRETAYRLADITKQTWYNVIKRAENGDKQAQVFIDAAEKAEASAEKDIVANVKQASKLPQFWAAGMTLLERKYPERWGRRNEDGQGPKILIQIGAKDSDLQVHVQGTSTVPSLTSASLESESTPIP